MNPIPVYRPYVFLRCRKCGRKTDHVLVNTVPIRKGEKEETYECQECGETKKIYELASTMEPEDLSVQELEEKIKAKQTVVEQLESKKRDLEKRLKEPQKKSEIPEKMARKQRRDPMEVTIKLASASSKQPKKSEEQPKSIKIKKKKRKWF